MDTSLFSLSDDKVFVPVYSTFLLLTLLFWINPEVKAVQVIGGNITVVSGHSTVLPCKLTDTDERVSQISWQRKTRKKPKTDNFLTVQPSREPQYLNGDDQRFKFIGSIDTSNGSLQFSKVTLLDEGVYTCIFTLFPSGNHETQVPLNVLVPPVMSVKDNPHVEGLDEVALATCTAAGSRPPAEVKWVTGTLTDNLKTTTNSTLHANGTTTTVITLFGKPSREIRHHPVKCEVTGPALSEPEVLTFTLQIYFSPVEVKIKKTSENTFECLAEANPSADFTWRRSGPWPLSSVRAAGPVLTLLSLSSELNGLYECEATNSYGRKNVHLYVHVTSGTCTVCWVLFALLCLILIAGCCLAAYWYFFKYKKPESRETGSPGEMQELNIPTNPPES